jgi:hypothetical protein
MAKRKPVETPVESFERLRQCFDCIKENHSDPWSWHEYLNPEPSTTKVDEDDDPEANQLSPVPRGNIERLKSHLLACVGEFQRASQAADMCYYHMSTSPHTMKECVIILGTSGDVDEEMLASGDASPQKMMAMMQDKITAAKETIGKLEDEVNELKERLINKKAECDNYWCRWQSAQMNGEEAMLRLNNVSIQFNEEMEVKRQNAAAYQVLENKHTRCDRLMKYQGREIMKVTFKANKKENLFYAFVGFVYVLTEQKAERERREAEARRDAVEFSLKNEVKFLIAEIDRRQEAVQSLSEQTGRLKHDRKNLAGRIIAKMRKYEPLEYCLWVWELWQTVRATNAMKYEKELQREKAAHQAAAQQLVQTAKQVPLMARRMDILKRQMVEEKTEADLVKRAVTVRYANIIASMWENMFEQRLQETKTLERIHVLDCEAKDERIAVLERDIAEDKHIQALKGMVVDLETRLKRALDRRKQRGLVVPPNKGMKCVMCSREILHRNWKDFPTPPAPTLAQAMSPLSHSHSEADMSEGAKNWRLGLGAKYGESAFSAVWRPP